MARALGRYELLRPLARGGMADVYLARRRAAGIEKWLVVKRMRPERSGDARFLDLFVREARLSMSLVHQNIVPVFDFGRIDDQVFLAMERVEGRDLGSSLARAAGHRLPPLLAAFVAAECCQALDYAHQRKGPDGVALGVVHRDVTPRNVLLSWSGEVKLTDFGIAALAGEATSRLLGTPQYMAPEQARREPIDPRADVYAVGLVLREAVSGVRPRPGGDRDAILDAARRGVLVPWPHSAAGDAPLAPGSGDPGAPPPAEAPPAALVAIVERATAAAPADRYPDARSMLEDLDAFILAERAAHRTESPARQLAAWLAAVWEGAGDDAETEAAIAAEHLVSFVDDGAMDAIGTGTVRSLAATAAEDAPSAPPAAPATHAAEPAAPVPPPIAPATVVTTSAQKASSAPPSPGPAPRGPSGGTARSSRISSSTSTIAAGSFHAIPASNAASNPASNDTGSVALPQVRPPRRRARLAGIALVATAGAAVLWIAHGFRGRDPGVAGRPALERPVVTPPIAGQPTSSRAAPRPPTTGQPAIEPITPQEPAAGPPSAEPPGAGPPSTRHVGAGRAGAPPSTAHAGHGRGSPTSSAEHPDAAQAGHDRGSDPGSAGGGEPAPGGSDHPRPATCKVRINVTPWAYYTADEGSTRYETPGTIDLPPGPHRLHVWNPELHVARDIVLDVPADRDTMNFSEPLQPTSLPPTAPAPR